MTQMKCKHSIGDINRNKERNDGKLLQCTIAVASVGEMET